MIFCSSQHCPQPWFPSHLLGSPPAVGGGCNDSSTEEIFTQHISCASHFPRYKTATEVKMNPSSALLELTCLVGKTDMHQPISTEMAGNPEYQRATMREGHQPRPGTSEEVVSEWRREKQEGISQVKPWDGERGRREQHKGPKTRERVKFEEAEIQQKWIMKAEGLTSQKKKSGLYLDHEREPTKGFSRRPLNKYWKDSFFSIKKVRLLLLSEKNCTIWELRVKFYLGWMRTVAQETAFQRAWETPPRLREEELGYIRVLQ